jgi:hypothetical protein
MARRRPAATIHHLELSPGFSGGGAQPRKPLIRNLPVGSRRIAQRKMRCDTSGAAVTTEGGLLPVHTIRWSCHA